MEIAESLQSAAGHTVTIALQMEAIAADLRQLENLSALYEPAHSLAEAQESIAAGLFPYWPHLPSSEQETRRNGSHQIYLYLYWKRNRHDGTYLSPRPKGREPHRKTYIGCNRSNIDLARLMTKYHRQHLHLATLCTRHTSTLYHLSIDLGRIANRADDAADATARAFAEELESGK